jgi:hypothetical protein
MQYGALVIGLLCLLVLLGVVLWLVRLTAQAGLIDSAVQLEAGRSLTFGDAVGLGAQRLGRFVGINLLLYSPFIILGILGLLGAGIAVSAGLSGSGGEDALAGVGVFMACLGILACLLVPVGIVLTIIYPFAQRGAVLQDLGVVDSIRHGWQVVRDNVGEVAVLIIIFLLLGLLVGIAAAVVLIPIALATLLPVILNVVNSGDIGALQVIYGAGIAICLGLLGAAIQSILVTFRSVTVTLAYEEFTGMDKQPAAFEPNMPA